VNPSNPIPADDAQLARDLLAGSPAAFDHFVDSYNSKLFRYSYAMCRQREDAEEVAQETLMKVFQNLDQLQQPERLKPWIFRIAKNACLMKRRKSVFAPKQELSLDELRPVKDGDLRLEIADWSQLPDELAANKEFHHALDQAVAELPELYRAVFLLRDVENLTTEDAAEILGISTDAVKTRLHRARLALRKQLDQYLRHIQASQPGGAHAA
jgi:RNA polymerase sigma-70 factor (ECF subfamily)